MPRPQSTASDAPVIADASSEATNNTRLATSVGLAMRAHRMRLNHARFGRGRIGLPAEPFFNQVGPRVHPGDTAFTRMPNGA